MIDKYKINRIVEYIKLFDFVFETYEVMENLNQVLVYYDVIDADLTDDEYLALIDELLPSAEQFEFREVAYLGLQDDSVISQIPERKFSLEIAAIERKLGGTYSYDSAMELVRKLALA